MAISTFSINNVSLTKTDQVILQYFEKRLKHKSEIKISEAKIASVVRCCTKTVSRAVKKLEKAGLLKICYSKIKYNLYDVNTYQLTSKEANISASPLDKKSAKTITYKPKKTTISISKKIEKKIIEKHAHEQFELLAKDTFLDHHTLKETEHYFDIICSSKQTHFFINGVSIIASSVKTSIEAMDYSMLKELILRITALRKNSGWCISSPYSYYLHTFWNASRKSVPSKPMALRKKNSFFDFEQRDIDFEALERAVIANKTMTSCI